MIATGAFLLGLLLVAEGDDARIAQLLSNSNIEEKCAELRTWAESDLTNGVVWAAFEKACTDGGALRLILFGKTQRERLRGYLLLQDANARSKSDFIRRSGNENTQADDDLCQDFPPQRIHQCGAGAEPTRACVLVQDGFGFLGHGRFLAIRPTACSNSGDCRSVLASALRTVLAATLRTHGDVKVSLVRKIERRGFIVLDYFEAVAMPGAIEGTWSEGGKAENCELLYFDTCSGRAGISCGNNDNGLKEQVISLKRKQ